MIEWYCKEDETYPDGLDMSCVEKIECLTSIGFIDVTDDFEYTRNSCTYRFYFKG